MVPSPVEAANDRQIQKDDLAGIIEKSLDGVYALAEACNTSPDDQYARAGMNICAGLVHHLQQFYENGQAYHDTHHYTMTAAFINSAYHYHSMYIAKKARKRIQNVQTGAIAGAIIVLPFSRAASFVCMAFALANSYNNRFWQKIEDMHATADGAALADPNLGDQTLLEETLRDHATPIQEYLAKFQPLGTGEYMIIDVVKHTEPDITPDVQQWHKVKPSGTLH